MNNPNIDPELLPAVSHLKAVLGESTCFNLDDLASARGIGLAMAQAGRLTAPNLTNVSVETKAIHDEEFNIDVELLIYKNKSHTQTQPAIIYLHGGGYVLGAADQAHAKLSNWCDQLGVSIISVEYRLAPEHPFPAALFDCFAALKWLSNYAENLNIDSQRIAIVGESAGGGLAAGLSLYARDHSDIKVAFQYLIYPMIDHTNIHSNKAIGSDAILWNHANNKFGWQAYLGDGVSDDMLQYAAPYTSTNLSALPPSYIAVGDQDLFYRENLRFTERLKLDGNVTQLEIYAGGFHGFAEVSPTAAISQRFNNDLINALRDALHV